MGGAPPLASSSSLMSGVRERPSESEKLFSLGISARIGTSWRWETQQARRGALGKVMETVRISKINKGVLCLEAPFTIEPVLLISEAPIKSRVHWSLYGTTTMRAHLIPVLYHAPDDPLGLRARISLLGVT